MAKVSILAFRGPTHNSDGRLTVAAQQHLQAADAPHHYTDAHGRAVRDMVVGWAAYADAHADRFESPIGDDYVLGPVWESIGHSLCRLLDGETGGLDCGSLDGNIRDALEANGFSREW